MVVWDPDPKECTYCGHHYFHPCDQFTHRDCKNWQWLQGQDVNPLHTPVRKRELEPEDVDLIGTAPKPVDEDDDLIG